MLIWITSNYTVLIGYTLMNLLLFGSWYSRQYQIDLWSDGTYASAQKQPRVKNIASCRDDWTACRRLFAGTLPASPQHFNPGI